MILRNCVPDHKSSVSVLFCEERQHIVCDINGHKARRKIVPVTIHTSHTDLVSLLPGVPFLTCSRNGPVEEKDVIHSVDGELQNTRDGSEKPEDEVWYIVRLDWDIDGTYWLSGT